MNKKALFSLFVICIILLAGVGFWGWQSQKKVEAERQITLDKQRQVEEARKKEEEEQKQENAEIESVKDLVDGEYDFGNVDTSDWQTYRNEEMGFEVKIPKDWFCGKPGLMEDASRATVCLAEKDHDAYDRGKSNLNVAMFIKNANNNNDLTLLDYVKESNKKEKLVHNYIVFIDGKVGLLEDFSIQNYLLVMDEKFSWNVVGGIQKTKSEKDIFRGIIASLRFLNSPE